VPIPRLAFGLTGAGAAGAAVGTDGDAAGAAAPPAISKVQLFKLSNLLAASRPKPAASTTVLSNVRPISAVRARAFAALRQAAGAA